MIVAKKTIVSQVANRSCREEEFQRFSRRYSLEFVTLDQQILTAIPRTLHEVSAGASWITMLCHTHIRELPIWQFGEKVSHLCPVLSCTFCTLACAPHSGLARPSCQPRDQSTITARSCILLLDQGSWQFSHFSLNKISRMHRLASSLAVPSLRP